MTISDSASFFLLHCNELSPARYQNSIISTLITVAKSLIPLFWKSNVMPILKDWVKVNEVYQFAPYKIDVSKPKQQENFIQKWFHWLQLAEMPV
ncbi:hypothetical protein XELAEV_18039629mg [Xenopus laevis]|uniref:Uncharacterized protein n=1 Tax=Xenopus laevis TaxID=8355 RepID=A0A974H8A5_XENLA|nr:hypothetical protein XELAEV_18039629mg [Xenopus laevis]